MWFLSIHENIGSPTTHKKIFLLTAPIANFPAYLFVTRVGNMALRKFLRPVDKLSSSPKVINEAYTELRETQDKGKKRGVYQKLSSQEKAMIDKYVSEHCVASVVHQTSAGMVSQACLG